MIYYALFFFVEGVLLLLANLMRSRSLSILAAMTAIAFCGLRFETGYDYNSYRSFFEEIWIFEGLIEPGFYYFIYFANAVGASSFDLFFLFSLLTHGLAYYTLSQTSNSPNLAFLIYLLIPGLYLNSFSILRSAFALTLFGYAAFRLISGRPKIEYLAWAILATSFHFTAALPFFIAFIIFLGPRGLPSRSICMLLLICCLIASQLPLVQNILGMFAGTKFESYVEMNVPQAGLKILASNLLAIFIIYRSRYFQHSQMLTYFFKVWLVGALLFNLFIEFSPVTRISYYFGFLSIPLMIHAASVHGRLARTLSPLAIVVFFSVGFMAALYNDTLAPDPLNMSNYKTIFEAP